MPRPDKYSLEELSRLAEEFLREKALHGSRNAKISDFGRFLRERGFSISDKTLLRKEPIVKMFQTACGDTERPMCAVAVFVPLDLDDFFSKNNTIPKIRAAISERELYYRNLSADCAAVSREARKSYEEKQKLSKLCEELRRQLEDAKQKADMLAKQNKILERKSKALKETLETYVYPEIANELLIKDGVVDVSTETINRAVLDEEIVTPRTRLHNTAIEGLFDY